MRLLMHRHNVAFTDRGFFFIGPSHNGQRDSARERHQGESISSISQYLQGRASDRSRERQAGRLDRLRSIENNKSWVAGSLVNLEKKT